MRKPKEKYELVFRPRGRGNLFFMMLIICCFIVPAVIITVFVFTLEYDVIYRNYWYLILSAIIVGFGIYWFIIYNFKRKVAFAGNHFICNHKGNDVLPPIDVECFDLIDFKPVKLLSMATYIEFAHKSGAIIKWESTHFGISQITRILQEIQLRGGIQGIDIDARLTEWGKKGK